VPLSSWPELNWSSISARWLRYSLRTERRPVASSKSLTELVSGPAERQAQGEAAFDWVEEGAIREGEAKLVTERRANGGVEYGP
jgi:hypothetical protein